MNNPLFFIRRISFATPEDERARLVSELKDLYAAQDFDGVLRCVGSFLSEGAEGERSDVVHDHLAFLAERMIEMNKDKRKLCADPARRPFQEDLGREHSASMGTLRAASCEDRGDRPADRCGRLQALRPNR